MKAIVSFRCMSNYRDLFNLRHLVHHWCSSTRTFFLSCNEITMTLEDVTNRLLLPILGDTDLCGIHLSAEKKSVEAELKKGHDRNMKLSYWVRAFSKASTTAHRAAFVTFWLCKFIFDSHPHYAVKPIYFQLAIKISAEMSLPLAPMFLGHLYV